MTTAQRPRQTGASTTQQLKKPMTCGRCKTAHFEYQLTCKRCGDYLDKRDAVVSDTNMGALKLGLSAAGIMVALVAICLALHIL